ncbi:Lipase member K [Portunus trituberculatus]|uniref:Lipase member K n=1 Tax=Portunus trituberculatus TaxID=210409 RepID=A0A5B7EPA4_PORTR|nr:Lipase member K [Portunus trituberculatus]
MRVTRRREGWGMGQDHLKVINRRAEGSTSLPSWTSEAFSYTLWSGSVTSQGFQGRRNEPELIRARGYPAEVHQVVTEDGYILEVHRIPHGIHQAPSHAPPPGYKHHNHHNPIHNHHPHDKTFAHAAHVHNAIPGHVPPPHGRGFLNGGHKSRHLNSTKLAGGDVGRNGRRVVFLFHGIVCSSADYVMNDPDQALGFIMADAGYDVWLGNIRGNFYGKRHVKMSPENPDFWDFSWSEVARFDIPAMLAYVKKTSGSAQVSYVGHSMGASLLFVSLHYFPIMNTWVRSPRHAVFRVEFGSQFHVDLFLFPPWLSSPALRHR